MTTPKATDLDQANRTIEELSATVQDLQKQIAWLKRQLFGRKSERFEADKSEGLFDHLPDPPEAETEDNGESDTETVTYKRRRGKRKPLPEDLPREERIHDLPEQEKAGMRRIGEEVSEQLEIEPGRVYVVRHIQYVYAREEECLDGSEPNVTTAPRPVEGLPKCIAGPSMLAYVAVSKFADHLPIYRQQKILERSGVLMSPASMGRWMSQLGEMCVPLMELMKARELQSHVIQGDETPVRQQHEGKGPTRQCYFYSYVGDEAHPYILYDYQQTRAQVGPEGWFSNARGDPLYHGHLQCDGYVGYANLFDPTGPWGMTHVGCWAHARRKFHDARLEAPGACCKALAEIRQLYKIEEKAKERADPDERYELRQEQSRPIVEALFEWCGEQQRATLPSGNFGQALTYALGQQASLEHYLEDGSLEIDNNACERSLRGIAIGRKNWLFIGNEVAGTAAATMFSLIASANRHGHDPLAYLTDVFRRLPATPVSQIGQFLPDVWQLPAAG